MVRSQAKRVAGVIFHPHTYYIHIEYIHEIVNKLTFNLYISIRHRSRGLEYFGVSAI